MKKGLRVLLEGAGGAREAPATVDGITAQRLGARAIRRAVINVWRAEGKRHRNPDPARPGRPGRRDGPQRRRRGIGRPELSLRGQAARTWAPALMAGSGATPPAGGGG